MFPRRGALLEKRRQLPEKAVRLPRKPPGNPSRYPLGTARCLTPEGRQRAREITENIWFSACFPRFRILAGGPPALRQDIRAGASFRLPPASLSPFVLFVFFSLPQSRSPLSRRAVTVPRSRYRRVVERLPVKVPGRAGSEE